MRVIVNGLPVDADVDDEIIDAIFARVIEPAHRRVEAGEGRQYVFLAAPPGAGKSTLAAIIEHTAESRGLSLQSIGLDGFHYPNSFLDTHEVRIDGKSVPMRAKKGAPETFDRDSLLHHLTAGRTSDLRWPTYDRKTHDVRPDSTLISAPIVLLEGNWILLDDDAWRAIAAEADATIVITAEPSTLEARLIDRKIQGGSTPDSARAFFDETDGPNVHRALVGTDAGRADLTFHLGADGALALGVAR